MLNIAAVLAGVLIVALVLFDIMATVLHPEVESPLSNRFHRILWRVLTMVQRLIPERDGMYPVLNWGLPLMIAGLIALWLVLFTIGFALIIYPWIGDDTVFGSANPLKGTFLEALYFSGVTLATLGYGDIQPLTWPFRILAVGEGMIGAVAVALSVAYVLGIYPALSRKRTIAVALDTEVAGQANALPMVRRYLVADNYDVMSLTHRLRELSLELLAITEAHETHPVLYYSHPRRAQNSFLRILVTAQSLVGLLRYGLSPDRYGNIVCNPQLLLLEQSLHYSLRRLSSSMHIPPIEFINSADERERLAADYERVCDELEAIDLVSARTLATQPVPVLVEAEIDSISANELQKQRSEITNLPVGSITTPITTVDGEGKSKLIDPALDLASNSPVESYVMFRLTTDPHIAAYSTAYGYPLEAARADYETTWWVSGQ